MLTFIFFGLPWFVEAYNVEKEATVYCNCHLKQSSPSLPPLFLFFCPWFSCMRHNLHSNFCQSGGFLDILIKISAAIRCTHVSRLNWIGDDAGGAWETEEKRKAFIALRNEERQVEIEIVVNTPCSVKKGTVVFIKLSSIMDFVFSFMNHMCLSLMTDEFDTA